MKNGNKYSAGKICFPNTLTNKYSHIDVTYVTIYIYIQRGRANILIKAISEVTRFVIRYQLP
jgi:hypothetical protein